LALLKMCHLISAFNLASMPLNAMPSADGQLKKKPDSAVKEEVSAQEQIPAKSQPAPTAPAILSEVPTNYAVNKTPSVQQPAAPVKQAEPVAEKPKVFIPNLHSPSTSVKIPSLKDWGKQSEVKDEEEEDPYLKGDDREEFGMDSFLKYWTDYAAKLKSENKHNVLSAFNVNTPVMLKPYVFEIIVGNKVQESLFFSEKPYILNFLRSSLKNFAIELNVRVDEKVIVKKPYTNQEKYQYMAAKNPQLAELKKRFNLDFD